MNKQELIKRIEVLPYTEGPIADTITINRNWILESIEQLDEPKKVKVPQFVADLLEFAKLNDWDLEDVFEDVRNEHSDTEISEWFYQKKNMDILARAWLDGYTIKKDKRYRVKMKGMSEENTYLTFRFGHTWMLSNFEECEEFRLFHTRKELEKAGFSEVFNSTLFEVEEVE